MNAREQIASVLFRSGADNYDVAVDMLTGLVDRLRAEAAAEELEEAARQMDDNGDQMIEIALCGAPYVHRFLCDRAAALRSEATS